MPCPLVKWQHLLVTMFVKLCQAFALLQDVIQSVLKKCAAYQAAFSQVGRNWSLSVFNILQDFTCRLYATRSQTKEVNELRYQLFRAKNGDVESGQLPPCEDCLHMHALRANYQTAIWRRCLENTPSIPNPSDGHGWTDRDGHLEISWMTGPPAPDVVLEFMSCKCITVCKLPGCRCLANGLECMAMCKLQYCDNMTELEEQECEDENTTDDDND